jgi:cell division septation protein DedD
MRDYEEKSYYEIQLDNKQLIFVFFAAVTVCVLIFILGVMVGKGQKEAEIAAASKEKPAVSKPEVDVVPPRQPRAVRETGGSKEKEVEKKEPSKTPEEQYTFYDLDKLEDSSETKQGKKSTLKQAEPVQTVETSKPKESASAPAPSSETVVTKPPEEKTSAGKPETTAPAEVAKYTVQVMATASRTKADEEIRFLRSKGFTPFLDEIRTDSGAVYKVRIGKFAEPESARQLALRLKKELQLETWVALLE